MKDYYETFFNKTFDVFHNLADDSYLPLSNTVNCSFNKSNPLKILFIGSLFKSLHDGTINIFCRAIDELNEEGYAIKFIVYGQLVPDYFLKKEFSSPNVKHHGTIPSKQRFNIMAQNHCFIVPSSFSKSVRKEYCYSIPTKLPELLLSSRPVIVLGPREMEAFRFCNGNNCGILIDDNSIESIKSKIIDLLLNFSRYRHDSMKTSRNLFSQLSITSQGEKFKNFVLN